MNILALDLGKRYTVSCWYQTQEGSHEFGRIPTTPQAIGELLLKLKQRGVVGRLVIEVSHLAGWVTDLARAQGILEVQVANPITEGWRWKNVKRKTDRDDALKLAKLSAANQLPTVWIPAAGVRQWRSLIGYRHKLVRRRTAVRNRIRMLLDSNAVSWPDGAAGWSAQTMAALAKMSRPLEACEGMLELWRGQLHLELAMLSSLEPLIEQAEKRLDAIAGADARVKRLMTIPGVGVRLSETVVAMLDDVKRFANKQQVGCYAGLTPRRYQSGEMDRSGRISKQGSGELRWLLVEIAWGMLQHNPRGREVFNQISKGQKSRRKQAAVALARRVLTWCWAMLRDERDWHDWSPSETPLPA
jgi:transposase